MVNLTAQTIVEIKDCHIGYNTRLFYVWLILRFGFNRPFDWKDCLEFGFGRRTVFRHLARLREAGMVYRVKSWRSSCYMLDKELYEQIKNGKKLEAE